MTKPIMNPMAAPRRTALAALAALALPARVASGSPPDPRWARLAEDMRRLALSWGDQGYGAVLVLDDEAVGLGPSRVVRDNDPDAHAERVAIRSAQQRLGRQRLPGAVLYSTSRPCARCEAAASAAAVSRMIFGADLHDAGAPRG
ncbi:MAG TPA: deaminase [Burkholderiaceae bacterium]|nr:deaminase [Burkholderiaceae bacterium]